MRYDDPDRDRGMLAPVDREFLLGEKEYEHRQSVHNRREKIRSRVRNTYLDFSLLFEQLSFSELAAIFGRRPQPLMSFEDPELEAGIRDTLAFSLEGSGGSSLLDEHRPPDTTAERLLYDAFEQLAWKYRHNLTDVRLEVESQRIPLEELLESLEAGEDLSNQQLAQLLIADPADLDERALQKVLREQLTGGE